MCIILFSTLHRVNNIIFFLIFILKIISERKLFQEVVVLYDPEPNPLPLFLLGLTREVRHVLNCTQHHQERLDYLTASKIVLGDHFYSLSYFPSVEMICPQIYKVMGYGMGERSKFEIEFKDNLYGMSRFIEDSSDEKMDIF